MAKVGIGVDIMEVARVERALARHPRLAERVFTAEERAYCDSCAHPAEHYAGRWAAREAVVKALGTGFTGGVGLRDVWVELDETGAPHARLSGRAAEVAEAQGVREVALSISHMREVAVANAIAVTDEARPRPVARPDAERELRASFREARALLDEVDELERARPGEVPGPAPDQSES